jgi:hypothetical protein
MWLIKVAEADLKSASAVTSEVIQTGTKNY